jgi:hypothetical protein
MGEGDRREELGGETVLGEAPVRDLPVRGIEARLQQAPGRVEDESHDHRRQHHRIHARGAADRVALHRALALVGDIGDDEAGQHEEGIDGLGPERNDRPEETAGQPVRRHVVEKDDEGGGEPYGIEIERRLAIHLQPVSDTTASEYPRTGGAGQRASFSGASFSGGSLD